MTSEMVLRSASEPMMFSDEQRALIRNSFASGASDQDFAVLMEVATARRLSPLLKQIHFVSRYDSQKGCHVWSCQVSIDGLRAIAERTGKYDGQDEPEYEENPDGSPKLCKVRVYRKDWTRPAVGVARWDEYVQTARNKATGKYEPTTFWRKMRFLMLAKVAEALALRKAFPEDMSGFYVPEEMAQASNDAPTDDGARERLQEPRREEPKALPDGLKVVATVHPSAGGSQVGALSAAPAVHHDVSGDNQAEAEAQASTKRPETQAMPPGAEHLAAAAAIEAEDADSTVAPIERFRARLALLSLPGDGVALWLAHRKHIEPLPEDERVAAWKSLCKQVETVGKMRNAGAWLKKACAVADELAAKQPEPDPNGPSGGRKSSRSNSTPANSQGGAAEGGARDAASARWEPVTTSEGVTIDDEAAAREHLARLHPVALQRSFARHVGHRAWCELVVAALARRERIDADVARLRLTRGVPAERRAA